MIHRVRARGLRRGLAAAGIAVAIVSCSAATHRPAEVAAGARLTGPLAALLAASEDLGPSTRAEEISAVSLTSAHRPSELARWADAHGLHVDWRAGHAWATLSGPARAMGAALGVAVHDYRSRTGHRFYAAQRQPGVPAAVRGDVREIGRLLNYSPHTVNGLHAMAPGDGLSPSQLINAYDATNLASASGSTTGTVVFFEWGPYKQSDLDEFARGAGLPQFSPQYVGGTPTLENAADETELDVEVVHAIAPHARLVIADAGPTLDGSTRSSVGLAIATLFQQVDRQFPGAVWSLSIGWGCERFYTGADMQPVESALEAAESHGTSVFDASGDTAGLECKGNKDYSTPPDESDVGVDTVATLPGVTSVGGTRLSTDAQGHWASEQAWDSSALSQGGSGGVSTLQDRPSWQVAPGTSGLRGSGHRLVPDVAADSDPDTGVSVVIGGDANKGGGTSQAAPIWAGFTILMDDYLKNHGGHLVGALNPVVYRIAQHAQQPAFHDITLGGDAVDFAGPGYDLVTGLGTPMIDNLVQDVLAQQRGQS